MYANEHSVDSGLFCPELVWREGLLIAAAWLVLLFFPQSLIDAGQVFATVATVMLTARASWKAGFTSVMLVLMGLVALAFGKLFVAIFFVCAAGGAVCTLVGTAYRRSCARDAARQAEEAASRRHLQSLREGELSVGAAFRQGHALNRAPGAVGHSPVRSTPAAAPHVRVTTSTGAHLAASDGSDSCLLVTSTVSGLTALSPAASPSLYGGYAADTSAGDSTGGSDGSCAASGD